MREVDYIIVGLGIAGICFCEELERQGKSFVVFDASEPKGATSVAGGVVNPVVLKRFTPVWNVSPFLKEAFPFYQDLNTKLQADFLDEVCIDRVFKNRQEQNDWLVASDGVKLSTFLSAQIISNANPSVDAPFGLGRVGKAFRMNTTALLNDYRAYLEEKDCLIPEAFKYGELVSKETLLYQNYKATSLVFAEGASVVNNPYFVIDSIIPKKGEYIVIKAPELKLQNIVKGPFFVIPLGEDLYKVGATFAHGDMAPTITEEGKMQLVAALEKLIHCPFEVVDQMAGFRPTVKDRRPLLGNLSMKPLYFLNGLGTRGLLMAPLLARQLYDFIENGLPLPEDVNIRRFLHDS
ncbi:MAG: FAD-dependent oxidoreductase [Bacteroidota bacterium]